MHIGVPTTSYPRFAGDPAGTFVRSLCLELVRRGHTCEVIAPDDPLWAPERDVGITVRHVEARVSGAPPAFYGAGVPDNVRRDPRAALGALAFGPRLVREVRERSRAWDAALTHWALPSAIATGLAFGARRHVAVWHSADVRLARALFGRGAWRVMRRAAAEHAFVAEHLRARLGAARDLHAHVVPMGVDLPTRDVERGSRGRPLRALVLARLVPIKRVELAIEACADADVELVIAGDGPERARLEVLARRRGGAVRFVGVVDEAQRMSLFTEADVLFATSAHDPDGATEGYPVAPREALAHGVVVIATRDPVHEELARRCGSPVILADPRALASELEDLGRDPARLAGLSRRASRSVIADGWAAVGERIEAMLTGEARRVRRDRSDLDATRTGMR